jgi:hypothetical protein
LNMFDFASGFYACAVTEVDQPYICFYVEGCGFFKYLHMPFGLTGAPLTFAQLTADALGDLVGILFELLWTMVVWRVTILTRCCRAL